MSEYMTTIGKVANSGKVHMAHGRDEDVPLYTDDPRNNEEE